MEVKILILSLSLLVLASGQNGVVKSYDWRTTGGRLQEWPKLTSLIPYERQVVTESYPVIPDHHITYQDDSIRPYQDDSYSGEYHAPYQYPGHLDQGLSSYEQPYYNTPKEVLNMTTARIGGFAGSGDTRGFGAYDFPKSNHHQEEDHENRPKFQKELRDLIKISRNHNRGYHSPDPLVHPIPSPL